MSQASGSPTRTMLDPMCTSHGVKGRSPGIRCPEQPKKLQLWILQPQTKPNLVVEMFSKTMMRQSLLHAGLTTLTPTGTSPSKPDYCPLVFCPILPRMIQSGSLPLQKSMILNVHNYARTKMHPEWRSRKQTARIPTCNSFEWTWLIQNL